MTRWSEDMATFRRRRTGGLCEIYRLQLRAATDDYRTLEDELLAASCNLEEVNTFAAADGYYQLGEIRPLLGGCWKTACRVFACTREGRPTRSRVKHWCGSDG